MFFSSSSVVNGGEFETKKRSQWWATHLWRLVGVKQIRKKGKRIDWCDLAVETIHLSWRKTRIGGRNKKIVCPRVVKRFKKKIDDNIFTTNYIEHFKEKRVDSGTQKKDNEIIKKIMIVFVLFCFFLHRIDQSIKRNKTITSNTRTSDVYT